MLALNRISIQGNFAEKNLNTMKQPPREWYTLQYYE